MWCAHRRSRRPTRRRCGSPGASPSEGRRSVQRRGCDLQSGLQLAAKDMYNKYQWILWVFVLYIYIYLSLSLSFSLCPYLLSISISIYTYIYIYTYARYNRDHFCMLILEVMQASGQKRMAFGCSSRHRKLWLKYHPINLQLRSNTSRSWSRAHSQEATIQSWFPDFHGKNNKANLVKPPPPQKKTPGTPSRC